MLTGLNHLTLAVSDLDRSVAFYRALPGVRLEATWAAGAYLSVGELWLCLSLDSQRAGRTHDYTHYAFSVDHAHFAATVEVLRALNAPSWKDNRSEGDSFYFLDPDGHQLEIHVGTLASRLAKCREAPYKGMTFY